MGASARLSVRLLVVFGDGKEATVDWLTVRPSPFNPVLAGKFETALRKRAFTNSKQY